MKIIPKFLKGGGFDSFFTTYTPVPDPKPAKLESSSSSKKGSSMGDLTEKDFFNMIKDLDGLPNEMNALVTDLMNTFKISNLTGLEPGSLATMYLQSLYKVKLASQNKEKHKEAVANARKNGALYEPAISPNGKLITLTNNGSITEVDLDTFLKNKDQYHLLSVSNLANLREYSPQFANNQNVFDIINNSMGYEAFLKLISDAKTTLGSSEAIKNGYFTAEGEASKGLALLASLQEDDRVQALGSVTAQGLYEYKIIDKSLLAQLNALTNYLVATLPDNAKTWAALKLGKSDKNLAVKDLVLTYLISGTSTTHSFDINYKGESDSSGSKSSSSSSKGSLIDDLKLNTAAKWLAGYGSSETFSINLGSTDTYLVNSNTMPLVKMNGDYLGSNSTLLEATRGQFGSILDLGNVSMGGTLVDPSAFNQIILSDGKISSVDFPCIEKGGTVVPDMSPETRTSKKLAEEVIKSRGINLNDPESIKLNYLEINQIYQQHNLPPAYNADGSINNQRWRRFGVINAATDGRVLGDNVNPNLLEEITDDFKAENIINIIKLNNEEYSGSVSTMFGLWDDTIYLGTLWIPIKVDYQSALANENLKVGETLELEKRQQALDTRNQLTLGRQPL